MKLALNSKILSAILGVFSIACFASDPTDLRGIDKIDPEPGKYGYFVKYNESSDWYNGWGYYNRGLDTRCSGAMTEFQSMGSNYWIPCTLTARTITGDIKGAILDRDRFDVALAQNRFFDAWCMGGETEQGLLWKQLAFSQSKKHLKQLVRESVFEGKVAKLAEARGISAAFPAESKAELDELIVAEEIAAREVLAGLAPDVAARTVALRTLADRLFE